MPDFKDLHAFVFDAYGTLFHIGSLDKKLSTIFGEKANEVAHIWRSKQLEYTWLRTLMGSYQPFSIVTGEALRLACNKVGVPLTEDSQKELVEQYGALDAFPEVVEVLASLSQSFRLAILSNANPEMLERAADINGLSPHMECILSVDKVRAFKPHPSVYQIAVNALDLEKEKIGFISTNTWDVAGASAFGFKAIHLNRFGTVQDELGLEKAPQITSLSQLLE